MSGVLDVIVVLVLGAFVGFAGATWRGLRTLRRQREELAQARLALRREVARNAELSRATTEAHKREQVAVAQVVALTYAQADATARAQTPGSKASADVVSRFCWN